MFAVLSPSANAGNAYGKDDNPGQAKGHAVNGGPATPSAGANANANANAHGRKAANANAHGKLASAMGSLNAAHASINGLAHASKKSRVGKLAAYMDAMVSYEEKEPLYHQLVDELIAVKDKITAIEGELNVVEAKIGVVEAEIGAVEGKIADIDGGITDLTNQIAALDPEDETYDADKAALGDQIAALEGDKAALGDQIATLEGDKAALEADQAALEADQVALTEQETKVQGALDTVTTELNTALTLAADNLKQAANKDSEIDAATVNAVNALLDGKSEDFTHSEIIQDAEEDIAKLINDPA